MDKPTLSDEQILSQIPAARERAKRTLAWRAYADGARYEAASRAIQVSLANGSSFSVPIALIPDLQEVSEEVLRAVTLGPAGLALRWEEIDADLSVMGLAQLVFGRRTLMAAAGSVGGAVQSEAKAEAARRNGRKGGRPKIAVKRSKSLKGTAKKVSAKRAPTALTKGKSSRTKRPESVRKTSPRRSS